jgi:hypothetical protein
MRRPAGARAASLFLAEGAWRGRAAPEGDSRRASVGWRSTLAGTREDLGRRDAAWPAAARGGETDVELVGGEQAGARAHGRRPSETRTCAWRRTAMATARRRGRGRSLRARPALTARGAVRCWRRGRASASRRTARDREVAGLLVERRAWTGYRGDVDEQGKVRCRSF